MTGGEPLARCDERAVPPPERVQRRRRRALAVHRAVRGVGLARPEPGGGQHRGDRPDAAGPGAPVSAAGRPADVRLDPDLAQRHQPELRFAKVGGERLHFETAYQRRTPGFEINDVGFLRQADQQAWTSWANLAFNQPNRIFQQLRWNFNNWEYWTSAGLPTERAFNTNVHIQFTNRWWLHMGGTLGQLGATYCDRCARGGPAVRQDAYLSPWITIEGDDRRPLVPILSVNYTRGDGGRSETIDVSPELDLKVSSRFTTSLSPTYNHNRNDLQYFGTFTDAVGRSSTTPSPIWSRGR